MLELLETVDSHANEHDGEKHCKEPSRQLSRGIDLSRLHVRQERLAERPHAPDVAQFDLGNLPLVRIAVGSQKGSSEKDRQHDDGRPPRPIRLHPCEPLQGYEHGRDEQGDGDGLPPKIGFSLRRAHAAIVTRNRGFGI